MWKKESMNKMEKVTWCHNENKHDNAVKKNENDGMMELTWRNDKHDDILWTDGHDDNATHDAIMQIPKIPWWARWND